MSSPWEVVMKFQQQLKPAAVVSQKGPVPLTHQNGAVQKLLPLSDNSLASRVGKVKDLIKESRKVIDESQPPDLGNSFVSFCQNCSCDNCTNQSMLLHGNDLNNSMVGTILQSYDKFLQTQKQQFVMMLQSLATELNTSLSTVALQQAACNVLTASSSGNQEAISESDSSDPQKIVKELPFGTMSSAADMCYPSSSIATTIPKGVDKCSPVLTSGAGKRKRISKRISQPEDYLKVCKQPEKEVPLNFSVSDSFDDYQDENFKPVRKSSLSKMKDCSVFIQSCENIDMAYGKNKWLHEEKSNTTLPSSEREQFLGDLTIVFQDRAPPNVCHLNKVPKVKPSPVNEPELSRTRAGRTVQKPRAFWQSSSRPAEQDNKPTILKQGQPTKRKQGRTRKSPKLPEPVNEDHTKANQKIASKVTSRGKISDDCKTSKRATSTHGSKETAVPSSSNTNHPERPTRVVGGRKKKLPIVSPADSSDGLPTKRKKFTESETSKQNSRAGKNSKQALQVQKKSNRLKNSRRQKKESNTKMSQAVPSLLNTPQPEFLCYFENELSNSSALSN